MVINKGKICWQTVGISSWLYNHAGCDLTHRQKKRIIIISTVMMQMISYIYTHVN